ncbi:class I SAM-dependent methyltransferase [bacterium]|nr:MAG: class I SAM-dependent methyltransferase [bacterium]
MECISLYFQKGENMNQKNIFKVTTVLILAVIVLFYPLTGCALQPAEKHTVPQIRFDDADKWVRIFEDPKRAEWQQPDKVVEVMNLKDGDMVVDIGAGTGYFTRRFARSVGPGGRAFGLDIETSLVNYMKEDAKKLNLKNYEARVIKTDDPELGTNSADVVFLCNTYHHIENRIGYFKEVSKSLKPGGRVVIVDFYKKDLPIGPPPHHKMSQKNVKKEFKQAGYKLIRSHDFLPYQYFLEFGL